MEAAVSVFGACISGTLVNHERRQATSEEI